MVPVFLVCFGVCVVYMGQVPEIKLMYVCMYVCKRDSLSCIVCKLFYRQNDIDTL